MFKIKVGGGSGTNWAGVRKVVEDVVRRGKTDDDRAMSSLIKDVERDIDEEGRTERSALVGFVTAKIVGAQVREVTRGMEEKTKGEIKRGGEEWIGIERKARRRVLVGGRSVYERAAREQIGWGEDCSPPNLERKLVNWSVGSPIRAAQTDYLSECHWLEVNWSTVWNDTKGGSKTSTRHFLTNGTKPIIYYLPRFNHSPTLALKRAVLLARDFRESPSNTTSLNLAVTNLSLSPESFERSAVASVIFELVRPLCALMIDRDFERTMEYTEEEVGELLEDTAWALDVGNEARRVISLISPPSSSQQPYYLEEYADNTIDFEEHNPPLDRELVEFTYNYTLSSPQTSAVQTHEGLLVAMSVILRTKLEQESDSLSLDTVPSLLPGTYPQESWPFSRGCLSVPVAPSKPTAEQRGFLDKAILSSFTSTVHAGSAASTASASATTVLQSSLNELTTLGSSWGLPPSVVSSMYVVSVWNLSRDMEVEEMLQSGLFSKESLDPETLVSGGMFIAAKRMQGIVEGFRKEKSLKGSLGMVDASMMLWVKDTSKSFPSSSPSAPPKPPSIQRTHQLILHLLRYEKHAEATGGGEEGRMERIHGLSIMSNILLSEAMKVKKGKG
jgi:hypothetical protein